MKRRTAILSVLAFVLVAGSPALADESARLEKAFSKGLDWLMAQQDAKTGAWLDPQGNPDVAFTALAVVAGSRSPEAHRTRHAARLERGCAFLVAAQQENGAILDAGRMPVLANYKTAIAVMAFAAAGAERYEKPLARARDYLVAAQYDDGSAREGGWGYDETNQKPRADMSNSTFSLEALHAAGVAPDSPVWQRAVRFLSRCQNNSETNDQPTAGDDGGFIYEPGASKAGEEKTADGKTVYRSYGSMTYAGLLSFIHAHVDKKDPRVQSALDWIRKNYTLEENPGLAQSADPAAGKQGLFYYYHTFAKALDAYGEPVLVTADGRECRWAADLLAKLAPLQAEDGSWRNDTGRWWEDYAPLVTAYSLLALQHCRPWVAKDEEGEKE